jgi:hypothetical protein
MLVVRDSQLRHFGLERERDLAARLLERLARDHPDDFASLGPDRAAAFIQDTIRSAAMREIRSEAAIDDLLRLYVSFGLDLGAAPFRAWASGMLDRTALPGTVRVNLVSRRLFAFTQGRPVLLHSAEE